MRNDFIDTAGSSDSSATPESPIQAVQVIPVALAAVQEGCNSTDRATVEAMVRLMNTNPGLLRKQLNEVAERGKLPELVLMAALATFLSILFEPEDLIELRPMEFTGMVMTKARGKKHPLAGQFYIERAFEPGQQQWVNQENAPKAILNLPLGDHAFYGANPRSGNGGTNKAVALARCIFIDLDDVESPEVAIRILRSAGLPEPSMLVSTGGGYHCYWRLTEPVEDLAKWSDAMQQVIDALKAKTNRVDKAVKDPARLLRLPGLINPKLGVEQLVRIVSASGERFELAVLLKGLVKRTGSAKNTVLTSPRAALQLNRNHSDDAVKAALMRLDPSRADERVEWIAIGHALKAHGPHMIEAWHEFSKQSAKYSQADCQTTWDSFNPTTANVASIFTKAQTDSPAIVVEDAGSRGRNGDDAQALQIVRLVEEQYDFGQTDSNEPFAVPKFGPNVIVSLAGSGGELKARLAAAYYERFKKVPRAQSFADALAVLQGMALQQPIQEVAIRVGAVNDQLVLDLATADGRAVVINRHGWKIVDRSPILFRRSILIGELPTPVRGGSLDELKALLNVNPADWALLLGWQVAALMPNIPHPILLLGGQHGAGKTTAAKIICGLIDPSPAAVRSPPKDEVDWCVTASSSLMAPIDNVSRIQPWWSDSLCRAVTGEAFVTRTLFTNSAITVMKLQPVIVLTSIDVGDLRGDLGERLLMLNFDPIPKSHRKKDADLKQRFRTAHPRMLGALLDLVVQVLAKLDQVPNGPLPRMADFYKVLLALDMAIGTTAAAKYLGQEEEIASDVVESDIVGAAIRAMVQSKACDPMLKASGAELNPVWNGTAGRLLDHLKGLEPERNWPKSPKGMSGKLKQLAPALLTEGIEIVFPDPNDKKRMYEINYRSPPVVVQAVDEPNEAQ